jgi:hypothetical protein
MTTPILIAMRDDLPSTAGCLSGAGIPAMADFVRPEGMESCVADLWAKPVDLRYLNLRWNRCEPPDWEAALLSGRIPDESVAPLLEQSVRFVKAVSKSRKLWSPKLRLFGVFANWEGVNFPHLWDGPVPITSLGRKAVEGLIGRMKIDALLRGLAPLVKAGIMAPTDLCNSFGGLNAGVNTQDSVDYSGWPNPCLAAPGSPQCYPVPAKGALQWAGLQDAGIDPYWANLLVTANVLRSSPGCWPVISDPTYYPYPDGTQLTPWHTEMLLRVAFAAGCPVVAYWTSGDNSFPLRTADGCKSLRSSFDNAVAAHVAAGSPTDLSKVSLSDVDLKINGTILCTRSEYVSRIVRSAA